MKSQPVYSKENTAIMNMILQTNFCRSLAVISHDVVMKWKHFPRYWPFVRGIHRSPVNSPHEGQWRGALMFSLICVWINGWVNNREAGDLRRHRTHYDVIVMWCYYLIAMWSSFLYSCGTLTFLLRVLNISINCNKLQKLDIVIGHHDEIL